MEKEELESKMGPERPPGQIGTYTKEEREEKIRKYKEKVKRYREAHPVNRAFKGRSKVADMKPRVKGRFVKADAPQSLPRDEEESPCYEGTQ
jgi:hypothetical protein